MANERPYIILPLAASLEEEYTYYCNEIIQQLQTPSIFVFGSWGVDKFYAGMAQRIVGDDIEQKPVLCFRVNGFKFKGWVRIFYNWNDLYEVEFANNLLGEIVKRHEDIYSDMLQDVVDDFVEKRPTDTDEDYLKSVKGYLFSN